MSGGKKIKVVELDKDVPGIRRFDAVVEKMVSKMPAIWRHRGETVEKLREQARVWKWAPNNNAKNECWEKAAGILSERFGDPNKMTDSWAKEVFAIFMKAR